MTTRAERHSSPRWPVAWFLSLRSPWRRVVKRNREREGRMTPLPLPAPTLTCWHGAFLILVCTVPRDFSSRIWTPLHPPKYIGMMCSLFTVRLVFWEGLMVIMTPTNRYLWSETRRVFLGCFSFLVVLSCWGGSLWLRGCVKVACSKKPFKGWAGVKKSHQVPVYYLSSGPGEHRLVPKRRWEEEIRWCTSSPKSFSIWRRKSNSLKSSLRRRETTR